MPTRRGRGSMGQQPMRRCDPAAVANDFSDDVVAIIFGCFPPKDIMRMRCVCKKWREAAKRTIVPMAGFSVDSVNKYNAVVAMATALPNLQQLSMCDPGNLHKYSDGEDQYEYMADYMAHYTAHDINIISNFKKLRCLGIHDAPLNGRYPVLFNFPLLRELRVTTSDGLKFDLGMLSGLPLLKELKLIDNDQLVGNLGSLRVLKDTLEKVEISCHFIEGNFMDLADFPRLKKLNLRHTSVTGDVGTSVKMIFPLWRVSFSRGLSVVVLAMSFSSFLRCLVSCRQSISSCNGLQRYSKRNCSEELSIGDFRNTPLVGMRTIIYMDVRNPHFPFKLFKWDHVVDGVGAAMTTIRARLTGLIQSQAEKAVATKLTLRNCRVVNGM